MKMLLLRVIVTLVACWIVKCDLMDLYVQHMDETMRTTLYRNKRHPLDPVARRIKRNLEKDKLLLEVGNFKKQRLDIDENWLKRGTKDKTVSYKNDVLHYPNKLEENLNSDQHEIFSTQNSKCPDMTSTIFEDAAKNLLLNPILQNPIIEERKDVSEVGLITVENQTYGELTVEALKLEEGFPEEMESEDNSQFEIISENERINPFVDPSFKRLPKPYDSRVPKKYFPVKDARRAKSHVEDEVATRSRRSASNGKTYNFTRYEKLDEKGTVILEWDPSDEEDVIFKVTARTKGYIGIGFNEKTSMKGADILLAWVDDHTNLANLLDLHGVETDVAPVTDIYQDVEVITGMQNETHTTVTFVRKWQTCDPQDQQLTGDTIRVLWALYDKDPELNTAIWHEQRRGGKALRLKTAAAHSPPLESNIRTWDVKLNMYELTDKDTTWCKFFKTPMNEKHHMIGYTPLVEKANEDLVHHITLYECAPTRENLTGFTKLSGSECYISSAPKEWNSCVQPILTWTHGSKGEWMPEHIGIPVAGENSLYYLLEIHYNNPMKKKVKDSSGVRLYLTENFRPHEAGILMTGVAVNPLHVVPPHRKEYASAGYCSPHCTGEVFPGSGINIVSVVLHSHLAGRRLNLKHIRRGKELPRIVQDNNFDFNYQQTHTLEKEVKVLPGDELVMECVYNTLDRTKPTLGGHAASQEMCLAFILYYPKTDLAACYSMTPVKYLFEILGIKSFRGVTMDSLEKLFLTYKSELISPRTNEPPDCPSINSNYEINKTITNKTEFALRTKRDSTNESEENNLFTQFVIQDPEEFRGRTLAEHMMALPWKEDLLTKIIEDKFYHGKHTTFCRNKNDKLALPAHIQDFPNYTALPEMNSTICMFTSGSSRVSYFHLNLVIVIIVLIVIL